MLLGIANPIPSKPPDSDMMAALTPITSPSRFRSGPPLLLLHGWPEFWATWEPMFDRLSDRYRLIAPDFRGFGESGNPTAERSDQAGPDVLADDIAAGGRAGWAKAAVAGRAMASAAARIV